MYQILPLALISKTTEQTKHYKHKIKLCSRKAQTGPWLFFCCRDLVLKPMTLKLDPDLDILKMYPQTENKVDTSSQCKGVARARKKRKQLSRLKVKVKCHQLPITFIVHHVAYSYQVTSISDQ